MVGEQQVENVRSGTRHHSTYCNCPGSKSIALIINYSPSLGPQFPHLYNKQVIVPCPVSGCSSEVTAPSSEGGFISSTADSATREMEPSPLHHSGSCQQEVGFCEPCFSENFQNGQACECLPKSIHGYLPAESLNGAWCGLQQ